MSSLQKATALLKVAKSVPSNQKTKDKAETRKISAGINKNSNNDSRQTNSKSYNYKNANIRNTKNKTTRTKENQGPTQWDLLKKPTTPQRKAILEPMQGMDRLLGAEDRWDRVTINCRTHRTIQAKVSKLRPQVWTKTPCLHSGTSPDGLETATMTKRPRIPEVVWQQPLETSVNYHKYSYSKWFFF